MPDQLLELDPLRGTLTPLDPRTGNPVAAVARRNRLFQNARGIQAPIADIPDGELIRTLESLGMPHWNAVELTQNPQLRLAALRLWVDVGDAGRGNAAAKERVDYVRHAMSEMRKAEIMHDDPRRASGDAVDPKVLL
jgi:hypothetical protein